jgi:hypothetical protein
MRKRKRKKETEEIHRERKKVIENGNTREIVKL